MTSLIRIFALAFLALFLAACNKTPNPPMVYGGSVWPGYEPFYLAGELGYYTDSNLRLAEYKDVSEVMQAFRNQTLHVAALRLDEALLLQRDVPDLRILLLLDESKGGDAILARPDISSMQQLKGQNVGVGNAAIGAYFLNLALQESGMRTQHVNIVPLPESQHEAAFQAGTLDAVVTSEPTQSRLIAAGAKPVFDSSDVPGKILGVLVTRNGYIGQYHAEIRSLIQGWRRALEYLEAEPDSAVRVMAEREQLTPAQFAQAMQGLEYINWQNNRDWILGDQPKLIAPIEHAQLFMLARGMLQMGGNAAGLIEPAFVKEDIEP